MNPTKLKILKNVKDPITIKELREKTGIKWANLSKHLKQLIEKGFVIELGKDGKSKVVQINKYKLSQHLEHEIETYQDIKEELI